MRFLGIILRVLRLEIFLYNVYITNHFHHFQNTFDRGGKGGGGYNPLVEVTVNSVEENSKDFCPNYVQEFGLCTALQVFLVLPHGIWAMLDAFRNKRRKFARIVNKMIYIFTMLIIAVSDSA